MSVVPVTPLMAGTQNFNDPPPRGPSAQEHSPTPPPSRRAGRLALWLGVVEGGQLEGTPKPREVAWMCVCVFLFLHTAWATRVAGGRLRSAKAPGHKAKGNMLAIQSQPCAELKSKAQTIPKVQKMRKRTQMLGNLQVHVARSTCMPVV